MCKKFQVLLLLFCNENKMNLSIVHTKNIEFLIDSYGPYKYFDIKHLGFHTQKAANRPPPKQKKCLEYAPLSLENVLLISAIKCCRPF